MKSIFTFDTPDRRIDKRTGADRRKTVRLFRHWQKLRGNRKQPAWSPDFRGTVADLWKYCILGKTAPTGTDTKIEEIGGFLREQLGVTGPRRQKTAFPAAVIVGEMTTAGERLAVDGKPVFISCQFRNLSDDLIKCRSVVLTFDADRDANRPWVGLASWKIASGAEAHAAA